MAEKNKPAPAAAVKCPACGIDNKENAKNCRKCGAVLNIQPMWSPTWEWHGKALAAIYAGLIVLFFALNWFLKPYMRQIPPEITPWLKDAGEIHKK
jgi:hypothetical protein